MKKLNTKIEVFFSIVITDILNYRPYQIDIIWENPVIYLFTQLVTKDPTEIFMPSEA